MDIKMKKIIPRYSLLLLSLLSFNTIASTIDNTKISKILIGPQFYNNVFLVLDTKPSNIPGCQTNSAYSYVFDGTTDVGKMTLSAALSAYAAQKFVTIGGGNDCTLYGNVENLNYILVK
jgi:hypothetical protein